MWIFVYIGICLYILDSVAELYTRPAYIIPAYRVLSALRQVSRCMSGYIIALVVVNALDKQETTSWRLLGENIN